MRCERYVGAKAQSFQDRLEGTPPRARVSQEGLVYATDTFRPVGRQNFGSACKSD
jgi:hypothetical protein